MHPTEKTIAAKAETIKSVLLANQEAIKAEIIGIINYSSSEYPITDLLKDPVIVQVMKMLREYQELGEDYDISVEEKEWLRGLRSEINMAARLKVVIMCTMLPPKELSEEFFIFSTFLQEHMGINVDQIRLFPKFQSMETNAGAGSATSIFERVGEHAVAALQREDKSSSSILKAKDQYEIKKQIEEAVQKEGGYSEIVELLKNPTLIEIIKKLHKYLGKPYPDLELEDLILTERDNQFLKDFQEEINEVFCESHGVYKTRDFIEMVKLLHGKIGIDMWNLHTKYHEDIDGVFLDWTISQRTDCVTINAALFSSRNSGLVALNPNSEINNYFTKRFLNERQAMEAFAVATGVAEGVESLPIEKLRAHYIVHLSKVSDYNPRLFFIFLDLIADRQDEYDDDCKKSIDIQIKFLFNYIISRSTNVLCNVSEKEMEEYYSLFIRASEEQDVLKKMYIKNHIVYATDYIDKKIKGHPTGLSFFTEELADDFDENISQEIIDKIKDYIATGNKSALEKLIIKIPQETIFPKFFAMAQKKLGGDGLQTITINAEYALRLIYEISKNKKNISKTISWVFRNISSMYHPDKISDEGAMTMQFIVDIEEACDRKVDFVGNPQDYPNIKPKYWMLAEAILYDQDDILRLLIKAKKSLDRVGTQVLEMPLEDRLESYFLEYSNLESKCLKVLQEEINEERAGEIEKKIRERGVISQSEVSVSELIEKTEKEIKDYSDTIGGMALVCAEVEEESFEGKSSSSGAGVVVRDRIKKQIIDAINNGDIHKIISLGDNNDEMIRIIGDLNQYSSFGKLISRDQIMEKWLQDFQSDLVQAVEAYSGDKGKILRVFSNMGIILKVELAKDQEVEYSIAERIGEEIGKEMGRVIGREMAASMIGRSEEEIRGRIMMEEEVMKEMIKMAVERVIEERLGVGPNVSTSPVSSVRASKSLGAAASLEPV